MKYTSTYSSTKWALSIIEVMVAIMIFATGISWIFMVVNSTVNANTYNKNYTIASNLAREQIELIRNIRDTNYKKIQAWNVKNPDGGSYWSADKFAFSKTILKYYKLENDTTSWLFPVKVLEWTYLLDFKAELKNNTSTSILDEYQLCIDALDQYVYCAGAPWTKPTRFYRYIEIAELDEDKIWWTSKFLVWDAFKVRSIVLWREKWTYSTEQNTVLTDWKRL